MKTNKISTKLNISGIFLTIIIIIILIISFIMNKASKKDSLIVNIAGLQRMLTQKMSKEILFINQNKYSDFQEAIDPEFFVPRESLHTTFKILTFHPNSGGGHFSNFQKFSQGRKSASWPALAAVWG